MPSARAKCMSALICLVGISALAQTQALASYPKLSPFSEIRWKKSIVEVRIEGKWYKLVALNGVSRKKIIAFCKRQWPDKWKKRFEEDLVEVLTRMGHEPERTVTLKVKDLDSGDMTVLKNVAMTQENRRSIWKARRQSRRKDKEPSWSAKLSVEQAHADIHQLRTKLETEFSYLKLKDFDYDLAFEHLRGRCEKGITRRAFATELSKIIARFGDGHARVRGKHRFLPGGFCPFLIKDLNGRLIALKPDHSWLLEDQCPFLKKIDGVDAERWITAAATVVPQGSPQMVRRHAIEFAHWIQFVRGELKLDRTGSLSVELSDERATTTKKLDLKIAARPPALFERLPRGDSTILDGRIGYLRIAKMDKDRDYLQKLHRTMQDFRETSGLIIDVRGNSGGSRDVLKALLPYFMGPKDSPRIVNVAAYRCRDGDDRDSALGYLKNRHLYPAPWPNWNSEERSAIDRFSRTFQPDWKEPVRSKDFSAWHYMIVSLEKQRSHYEKAVVILMDEACFSATDIFLGALKGLPNVTLMGRPSGGGSGRGRQTVLEKSRLKIVLSTMASFQPNGRLYDGHGIQPDVLVERTLDDILGKTDSTLDAALRHLAK
ncbi:MAG: S41 family peptidase [Phycisphaerales bacterium]|nr:S41 family peptidase [Phycisphaerales bacterium]